MKRQNQSSSSFSDDDEESAQSSMHSGPEGRNGKGRGLNMQTSEEIKKAQPQPKKVAFFDAFTFIAVAVVIFFNNLTSRSIIFDVVMSAALLVKVLIGICFYKQNNARSLRSYFFWRYLYNMFVVYPLIIILRYFTATYVLNYFLAGGITLFCELVITLCYIKHLCLKTPLENIQDIPGFVLKSQKGNKSAVIHIKSVKAAEYLTKQVGKKSAQRIVDTKLKQQEEVTSRKSLEVKQKSGKNLNIVQQLQIRKELERKAKAGFNLIRTEEEIEAEIEYEQILQQAQILGFKQGNKYMSFQDRMSRNVVNDYPIEEFIQQKEEVIQQIEDARDDIEREREKLQRAFQLKKGIQPSEQQEEERAVPVAQPTQADTADKTVDFAEENIDQDSPRKAHPKNVDENVSVGNGPKPSKYNQEETEVVEHSDVKIDFSQKPLPQSDQLRRRQAQNDEDVSEAQTDRVLVDKLPTNTTTTNIKSQSQKAHIQKNEIQQINPSSQPDPVNEKANEKQKFKSYQEKFEIQRIQQQNQQRKSTAVSQESGKNGRAGDQQKSQSVPEVRHTPDSYALNQSSGGKHAYAKNKIQQELMRKAKLKKQQEEQRRREEEGSDSGSSGSDSSEQSDETPNTRRRRKEAKASKKIQRQKTKKIHGVNDGGESSSSISDGEDPAVRRQIKAQQKAKSKGNKSVRFDENKNTVKEITHADHDDSSAINDSPLKNTNKGQGIQKSSLKNANQQNHQQSRQGANQEQAEEEEESEYDEEYDQEDQQSEEEQQNNAGANGKSKPRMLSDEYDSEEDY